MPWEGSKRRKEEKTHTEKVCVCVCIATEGVRSVKRKGSDQRRDETMEEARGRQGRVGGTVKATKLYVHIATLLFYVLSLWECFSFMSSSLFFCLAVAHIHLHINSHHLSYQLCICWTKEAPQP